MAYRMWLEIYLGTTKGIGTEILAILCGLNTASAEIVKIDVKFSYTPFCFCLRIQIGACVSEKPNHIKIHELPMNFIQTYIRQRQYHVLPAV